jgi:hypothetical protein
MVRASGVEGQLLALCDFRSETKSWNLLAILLWVDSWPIAIERLRAAESRLASPGPKGEARPTLRPDAQRAPGPERPTTGSFPDSGGLPAPDRLAATLERGARLTPSHMSSPSSSGCSSQVEGSGNMRPSGEQQLKMALRPHRDSGPGAPAIVGFDPIDRVDSEPTAGRDDQDINWRVSP